MNNIVRIIRKDIRRLWPQVILLWLLAIADAQLTGGSHDGFVTVGTLIGLLPVLAPLACWTLVIAVIHEEALVGDRQYWLTRPFTWRDLLAAKILFLAASINLPLFMFQACILGANGFSPLANLPSLLWRQVFFTAFMILPVASLAAVTKNFGQAVLGAVMLVAAPIVLGTVFGTISFGSMAAYTANVRGLSWISASAMAAVILAMAVVILGLQYSKRRTTFARIVFIATPILALLIIGQVSTATEFAIQSLFSPQPLSQSQVRISLDPQSRSQPAPDAAEDKVEPSFTRLEIPIRVDGLPPSTEPVLDMIEPRIESPAAAVWHPGEMQGKLHGLSIDGLYGGSAWLTVYVDRTYFDRVKNLSVDLSGSLYLTLLRPTLRVQLRGPDSVNVASEIVCRFDTLPHWVTCRMPVAREAIGLAYEGRHLETNAGFTLLPRNAVYGPYPVSPGFSPLQEVNRPLGPDQTYLVVEDPIAYIRRPFAFHAIHLVEYVRD